MSSLPNKRAGRVSDEAGFTIIEVLVAVFILLLGVLGTTTMIDTASKLSNNTKAREGATNLDREIGESARLADYDNLFGASATTELQSQSGLADSDTSTAGWQLDRRGIVYTVTVSACKYDDPKDGARSTSEPNQATFCSQSPAAIAPPPTNQTCSTRNPTLPCVDTNPDDFRRLAITASWTLSGFTRSATQIDLIVNPTGGRGPRITSFTLTAPSAAQLDHGEIGPASGNTLTYRIQTSSFAGSVNWTTSSGATGTATNTGGNIWTFDWPLTGSNPVVDGTYSIEAQAFSIAGTPGDVAAQSITINRSAPVAPSGVVGGRDTRVTPVVDIQWNSNPEADIVGYRVYRASDNVLVCGTVSTPLRATSCQDTTPTSVGSETYNVVAVDDTTAGALREGPATALPVNAAATPAPSFPGTVATTGTSPSGSPTITWTAADPGANAVLFYRIYRDPATTIPQYSERYDSTPFISGTPPTNYSYTDPKPGNSSVHTYYVTPVDTTFQEGVPIAITTP